MTLFLRPYEYLITPEGTRLVMSAGANGSHVELLDQLNGKSTTEPFAHVRNMLASGTWCRATEHRITGKIVAASSTTRTIAKERYNRSVVEIIKKEMKAGASIAEAHRLNADALIEDGTDTPKKMCSLRQAQRLVALDAQGGVGLTPLYMNRGNYRERHPNAIRDLILSLTETEYATRKSRIGIRSLTDIVNQKAREAGLLKLEGAKDKTSVSRHYVKRIVTDFWHPDLDYRRLDSRVARSAKAVAKNRIQPEGPLHRVEQDTVNLPFVVRTNFGLLKTLSLMLSIDCATSMPLGWRLVPRAVTGDDTLTCLEVGMYSKRPHFERLAIDCDIDPYGAFLQLHIDNGPENIGERIDSIAAVGIDVSRTAKDSPHFKPFIERLNRSLKEALETLPGCTRFDGKDGQRSDAAEKDTDLMTFEELERWIVRWLFEKWIHQPIDRFITADYQLDSGMGITPYERWKNAEKHFALPLPPDRRKWLERHYVELTRSLSPKTGVPFAGFRFRGPNLKKLIDQYGPDARITVRYNPADYRCIYAVDKHDGRPVVLINSEVSASSPAYSFDEARKRRKAVADTHAEHPTATKFAKDISDASMKAPKQSHYAANREMTQTMKTKEAVERARENPLPDDAIHHLEVDETYLTTDGLPTFDVEYKSQQKPESTP